ncbi:MAG: hypothetical protein EOO60_10360 [Hymenobacter sp.]|nr:MAG: hypothetical protein EOO60_10360 [Hymenobacter sp.]
MQLITSWIRWSSAVLVATVAGSSLFACSYTNSADTITPCNLPLTVSYQANVLPILKQQCYRCHSADKYKVLTSNTLNMEDFAALQYYATPANGRNNVSYLVGNIRHDPGFVAMPYDGGKLSDCEIATIKAWVDAGALSN